MRHERLTRITVFSGICLLVSSVLIAQILYSGNWTLNATFSVPEVGTCVFSGDADVSQEGTSLLGTANLNRVDGGEGCPPSMSANFSALVGPAGELLSGQMSSQEFGSATFEGSLSRAPGGSGSTTVTQGPFTGTTGSWSAQLGGIPVVAIPTLGVLGLASLIVLLIGSGLLLLRRRSSQPA
jgi:hypothetical protein